MRMSKQSAIYLPPDIETSSELYATRFSGQIGAMLLNRQREIIAEILSKYPAGSLRILDVGGGHAQLTETMLSFGHQVCVHGSRPDCQLRLEKLKLLGERVSFLVAPFDELQQHLGQFDVVTAFRLMAHLPNWKTFLRQLTAIADREVVIDFASLYSTNLLSGALFPLKKRIEKSTRPYYCHRLSEVRATFESLGFEANEIHKQFALPLALHRAVGQVSLSERLEQLCLRSGITGLIGSPVIISAVRRAATR